MSSYYIWPNFPIFPHWYPFSDFENTFFGFPVCFYIKMGFLTYIRPCHMILAESGFSSKIHQKSAKVPVKLTLRLRDLFFLIRALILHKDELSYLYAMLCHDFGLICLFSLKKLAKNQSKLPFVLTFRFWDHNSQIPNLTL